MKIALHKFKTNRNFEKNLSPWKSCLPFVENKRGVLVHRPKAVATITLLGKSHIAIVHWCGLHISGGDNLAFVSEPQTESILCARCEQVATKAGLESASGITGRHVHVGGVRAFTTCGCKKSVSGELEAA